MGLRPAWAETATFVGIDHSATAIAAARGRLPAPNFEFVCADINALEHLELGDARFDLLIALGTLHSPGVDDRKVLRELIHRRLSPTAALILGVPNCTHLDGEQLEVYGWESSLWKKIKGYLGF